MAGRNHRPAKVGNDLPTYEQPKGKSVDIAAESVGWSGEQYRKAKKVPVPTATPPKRPKVFLGSVRGKRADGGDPLDHALLRILVEYTTLHVLRIHLSVPTT